MVILMYFARWTLQLSTDTYISQKPSKWHTSPHSPFCCCLTNSGTKNLTIHHTFILEHRVCDQWHVLYVSRGTLESSNCQRPLIEESPLEISLTMVLYKDVSNYVVFQTTLQLSLNTHSVEKHLNLMDQLLMICDIVA